MQHDVVTRTVHPNDDGATMDVPQNATILSTDWRNPNRIEVALLVPSETSVRRSEGVQSEKDVSLSDDTEDAQDGNSAVCGYVKDDGEPCAIPSDEGYCHHHSER
jgi:hypothetical protein